MNTSQPTFFGLAPNVIEAATRKARRERSEAVWTMIQGIFPSVASDADKVDADRHVTMVPLNPASV
jgi:hypothetical protein